ncbi:MAG: DNA starvation/stationary phase protection protein [Henriciella sp.]|uniref:Dps family protein n=1 Tax=Henriciella sp. TaxID=1968823 RepID=UPI000C10E0EE|nr:DNA starvation/stationary phase protection protein [Henriciella sp.]MAN72639.1 DNA starvation/stationary phase protection protein [Henriciella sp.]MBF33323.1 DNA starvation/stationary phase protection protein [Hyphomonadaceae bacterium]MBK76409.1 DNA starvation/stationary phase protection protein [Henriciella sp.]PHR79026.1 MAG: DNA starvation/stationary phase protection protein [Henriciella sp.]|tara:strand:- start:2101 stop:2565 length:465 start_codon:yes stop_codon:yes gene_type:complete
MSVDVGLDKQDRSASIDALRKVLGETYALYFKTHGYHWNVTGPRFKALHELFMEQYTELWQALDELAERIRALGEFAPASSDEIASYATIKPDNGVPDAEDMINNLVRGHETIAKVAREGVDAAEQGDDVVTADLLTQRAAAAEKAAWMLRASV